MPGRPGSLPVDVFVSDADRDLEPSASLFRPDPAAEMDLVKIYPRHPRQVVLGFGAALTEAAAHTYASMPAEAKETLLRECFSDEGSRYGLCRTHIQSCDFSLGSYSYVHRPWDRGLRHFSLDRDERWLFPMISDVMGAAPGLSLLASPWSPPGFMKTNLSMCHGGRLRHGFYGMWADIVVRYVLECRQRGFPVDRLTVQNEEHASQPFESCLFDADGELEYASSFLRPRLDDAGLDDVGILSWDHNREHLLERSDSVFGGGARGEAFSGLAFHWYSGDHFEAIAEVRREHPGIELIMSEGCHGLCREPGIELDFAEGYAHDLIGVLDAGGNAFIDWNVLLDERGGPNHVGSQCSSLAWYDSAAEALHFTKAFSYLRHVSRFVRPGAHVLLTSRCSDGIEAVACANPDGSHVAVVLNRSGETRGFKLHEDGLSCDVSLDPRSIQTLCWIPSCE
ncbi:MAG: glycoside hydrolase family 30 beta sandwich domain-containing protein [Atopobiaceae bacterium]